jgi:hypothetical protein
MRIYILSNANLKKNILGKLEPYLQNTRFISYIWSLSGLLQVEDNKIYRMRIKDVLSRKTLLGAYPATIDESEFIREEECFQIAPRAYKEYMTLKSYRLPASDFEWILEYKDDELHDNYFSLSNTQDIHSPKIKAEILQFLSL